MVIVVVLGGGGGAAAAGVVVVVMAAAHGVAALSVSTGGSFLASVTVESCVVP